jgi:hypothetical protein
MSTKLYARLVILLFFVILFMLIDRCQHKHFNQLEAASIVLIAAGWCLFLIHLNTRK